MPEKPCSQAANHPQPLAQQPPETARQQPARGQQRQQLRQDKARPIIGALHGWMLGQRQKVPEGSTIAKALDYNHKRWAALARYLDDGNLPIDNNWIENQIRPWTLGPGALQLAVCRLAA